MTIFGAIMISSIILTSCGGNSNNDTINELLSKKDHYYYKSPSGEIYMSSEFLTFHESSVDYMLTSSEISGGSADRVDLTGTYSITKEKDGKYLIQCDFGVTSQEVRYYKGFRGMRPISGETVHTFPRILRAEIDSLNNVIIENWYLQKPSNEQDVE